MDCRFEQGCFWSRQPTPSPPSAPPSHGGLQRRWAGSDDSPTAPNPPLRPSLPFHKIHRRLPRLPGDLAAHGAVEDRDRKVTTVVEVAEVGGWNYLFQASPAVSDQRFGLTTWLVEVHACSWSLGPSSCLSELHRCFWHQLACKTDPMGSEGVGAEGLTVHQLSNLVGKRHTRAFPHLRLLDLTSQVSVQQNPLCRTFPFCITLEFWDVTGDVKRSSTASNQRSTSTTKPSCKTNRRV